jgi:hypothetical protein
MPIRVLEMCLTFPMQHMIDQFHQSEQFLHYFKISGVRYSLLHSNSQCIDLCFLKLNIGNKYGLCSELKKCPGIMYLDLSSIHFFIISTRSRLFWNILSARFHIRYIIFFSFIWLVEIILFGLRVFGLFTV